MYQFYPQYQIQHQQFLPWYNQSYSPSSTLPSFQPFSNSQYSSLPAYSINPPQSNINNNPKTLSDSDLIHLLDSHTNELKQLHAKDQQQQLPILINVATVLMRVPKSILVSTAQNEFFSLLRSSFTGILQQWSRLSSLSNDEFYMFYIMTKLIRRLIKATDDIKLLPSWVTDSSLLDAISNCLTNIAASEKFSQENNKSQLKNLIRLIDAYIRYQQRLNHPHKDALVQLLDPILHCLTSSQFIHTLTNVPVNARSMTTIEKLFLVKCSAFLTSYNGSRLEQTMESLLSTMLPQYVEVLDQLVLSAHQWKRSVIRSVHYLLQVINHGANQFQTNAKLISGHLSLIDDVLRLVNEPILYNNLQETLSNVETTLMNTAISFLVNMISEPSILAHMKQSQVASIFLRLTTGTYEPLVFNIYALLAYTTNEEDIKAMHNPGRLFATIIKSLKTSLKQAPNDKNHKEQLLETLKGLVQHDQMKDEVMKQNALPFLLECTNKLTDRAQLLIMETLWSLTFREEGAIALRSNDMFINKIKAISQDSKNEPLKKAADGLVWKLIREPAFLKKVAKQEVDEKHAAKEVLETIVEEVITSDGQKQLVTTVKPVMINNEERTFEYDIMISYCHADKELTYKIHKVLVDQGFKVWIDLDNMYGPAMNAMADAVENSEYIIMCMSDSYKRSTYCQAEAEYAFNCKRRLIPLIMRQGYRPDGWLGFMIGSRIYVDFGRFDFETACEKLTTEISRQGKQPAPLKTAKMGQHESPSKTISLKQQPEQEQQEVLSTRRPKPALSLNLQTFSMYTRRKPLSNFTRMHVIQWTESDVLDFLYTQRFIHFMPLCDGMDGRALIQLYNMCLSRSSKTYMLLDDELKSTYQIKLPIRIYTRFMSAMEQRLTPLAPAAFSRRPALPAITTTTMTTVPQEYVPSPIISSAVDNVTFRYPPYSDKPYDLLITSNAPALEVLNAVTRFAPNLEKMSSFLTRHSGPF